MKENRKLFIAGIISAAVLVSTTCLGQAVSNDIQWNRNGNLPGPAGNTVHNFGTFFPQPINVFTNSTQRATFFSTGGFAINRPGFPGTNTPGALLHIGDAFGPPGSAGHRTWMDVGTFCWQATDNMYVGLKDETALFGTDICILKRNSSGIYSQTLTCI